MEHRKSKTQLVGNFLQANFQDEDEHRLTNLVGEGWKKKCPSKKKVTVNQIGQQDYEKVLGSGLGGGPKMDGETCKIETNEKEKKWGRGQPA